MIKKQVAIAEQNLHAHFLSLLETKSPEELTFHIKRIVTEENTLITLLQDICSHFSSEKQKKTENPVFRLLNTILSFPEGTDLVKRYILPYQFKKTTASQEHLCISYLFEKIINGEADPIDNSCFDMIMKYCRERLNAYKDIPEKVAIFSLGCGPLMEIHSLIKEFPGQADIIGIDNNQLQIKIANVLARTSQPSATHSVRIIHADATQLDTISDLPATAHFILIRHQYALEYPQTFKAMFTEGLKRMTEKSLIIVTSYTELEHNIFMELIREVPCQAVFSGPVADMGYPPPASIHSNDRYVLIARKITSEA